MFTCTVHIWLHMGIVFLGLSMSLSATPSAIALPGLGAQTLRFHAMPW